MSKASESILRGASEALSYARGEQEGFVAHVPEHIDMKAIDVKVELTRRPI